MDRVRAGVLRQAIFSALGLLPLACGGASTGSSGVSGASSTSGSPAAAGLPSTGGSTTMGGSTTTPSGGVVGSSGETVGGAAGGEPPSGGAGGSAVGGASGGGGASASVPAFPCEDSMPAGETQPGYSRCSSGVWHRPMVTSCPPSTTTEPPGAGFGCINDSDCGAYEICFCGQPSACVRATCTSDADCGAGFVCRGYSTSPCEGMGIAISGFACQTPEDVCDTFRECQNGMRCGGDSGAFVCDVAPVNPGCGRPFLVDGAERVAPLCGSVEWLETDLDVELDAASAQLRARAARAWARIGQMEHASVAAFARFVLQLLQLGAPAALVERATRAASDEVRHARLAFALASLCAGESIGPGPLDVQGSLEHTSLSDVLRVAFREGCVGETIAALQVAEAASGASSPRLQALLSQVASDEAEHAELAWRFASWALQQQPSLSRVLEEELARVERAALPPESHEAALRGFGVLSSRAEAEIRQAALRDVIEPCVSALLAQAATPREAAARIAARS